MQGKDKDRNSRLCQLFHSKVIEVVLTSISEKKKRESPIQRIVRDIKLYIYVYIYADT